MADEADIANSYIDDEVRRALDKMRLNKKVTPKIGAKTCVECGEKVPDVRRKLGFSLCVECAGESERRKSLFAE